MPYSHWHRDEGRRGEERRGAREQSGRGTTQGLPRATAHTTHLGKRGEERVEVLGEQEARDGEHGHAAVLELGLTELVHLLLVGAGREAKRVEASGKGCAGDGRVRVIMRPRAWF